MKFKLLTLCIITLLLGCSKQAGEGGKSTVKGKILVEDWNNAFTIKNGEYPGLDVDVFIIYGDNVSYNDKTRANYNGEFEFKYLRKGKYTIYVITKDKTLQSASGEKSIIINFELTGKKETKTLDQITVYE
ncbi:MAG: hypothetical protein LCH32_00655 [Bacteroidetes bacterium]|nr:hypothetical protein [Bacteroidota bacterium]